jgi:hypothetical protein
MSAITRATQADVDDVECAIKKLQEARDLLKRAVCPRSADVVQHALRSAKAARRHIRNRFSRTEGGTRKDWDRA